MATKKGAKKKATKRTLKKAASHVKKPFEFKVNGPYELKVVQHSYCRRIKESSLKEFWSDRGTLASRKGCYIFCMSKRPFYVGKATKKFQQEVFNHKNLNTYQEVVGSVHGKPKIYLIALTPQKGKPPSAVIGQIEKLLIGLAHDANPDLRNVHHKNKEDRFVIPGVYNSGRGPRPAAASNLRSVLRLST